MYKTKYDYHGRINRCEQIDIFRFHKRQRTVDRLKILTHPLGHQVAG